MKEEPFWPGGLGEHFRPYICKLDTSSSKLAEKIHPKIKIMKKQLVRLTLPHTVERKD